MGIYSLETVDSQISIWELIGVYEIYPMKVLLPLFAGQGMFDIYVECKELVQNQKRFMEHKAKYGKKIYKELLPIAWHPRPILGLVYARG